MKRAIAFMLAFSLAASLSACSNKNEKVYNNAVKLFNAEKYAEAKVAFQQLGDYEDSALRIQKCDYEMATSMFLKGDYAGAQEAMEAMNGFKNSAQVAQTCAYLLAQEAIRDGRYDEAAERLKALGSYLDCEALLAELDQLKYAERIKGTWTAPGIDLAELVTKAVSEFEVTAATSADEEKKETEETTEATEETTEATEETKEADDKDAEEDSEEESEEAYETLDLVSIVKPTSKPTSFSLQLLPSGAFVMEMDAGTSNAQTAIGMEVRSQILKAVEDIIKEEADDWKEYLKELELDSIEDYLVEYYNIKLTDLIEKCVTKPIQEYVSGLPMYGAYRLEDGKVVLAVGTDETSAVLDGAGKLTIESEAIGTLEFTKK